MSVNPPPSPNVNRFNNLYWISAESGLTIGVADTRYLKFPTAQGTETLATTNVNGVLTSNSETRQVDTTNSVNTRLKQNNLTFTIDAGYNKPSTAFNINCNNNVSASTQVFNMSALAITTGGQQFTFNSLLPPLSSQTIPSFDDNSNIMPTTAWVQGAIGTSATGFQEGLILQDKNYNYDTIVGITQSSIFAGSYTGNCFACSANGSVCGLTNGSGADVWFYLPVGTGGAPQVNFNSAPFNFDFLTFSADGKWGLLLGEGGGVNATDVYRWDGSSFTITNAPALPYVSACMSANGKYALIADVSGAERLRKSTNYGLDWIRVASIGVWYDVCMSATGKYMFGMSQYQDGYISSDYGVTWTAVGIGGRSWYRCCMSANGQYIIALANDNGLADRCVSSNDFGVTWVLMGADQKWVQTAMTNDGRFQVAWYATGYYYSSNFGLSWTDTGGVSPTPRMSDDGRARFTNQGKYIVGNDGSNCNYSVFTELW